MDDCAAGLMAHAHHVLPLTFHLRVRASVLYVPACMMLFSGALESPLAASISMFYALSKVQGAIRAYEACLCGAGDAVTWSYALQVSVILYVQAFGA